MPEIISESKLVYPEFKFFKSIYTHINIAESVILVPHNEKLHLFFSNDSPYYLLQGEIFADTEFFKWTKTINQCKITLQEINILAKCLKKNAVSIEYENANYFTFKYLDKETNEEKTITFKNIEGITPDTFEKICSFKDEFELRNEFLNSEICSVFRKDNEISLERTKDKLIEIPSARIRSLIKNGKNKIFVGERDVEGNRYVAIESANNELGITLSQLFRTI